MPPQVLWSLVGKILTELNDAGFNEQAVDVLNKAGMEARVNEVGHIAVKP